MVGSEQHIKTLRLFNLSPDDGLDVTEGEETHLLGCADCQQAVEMFALLFGKQKQTRMVD